MRLSANELDRLNEPQHFRYVRHWFFFLFMVLSPMKLYTAIFVNYRTVSGQLNF
jgi:hypothetical protein